MITERYMLVMMAGKRSEMSEKVMMIFVCFTEAAPNEVDDAAPTGAGGGGTAPTVTVRKDFPDTWIWKSARTKLVDCWLESEL